MKEEWTSVVVKLPEFSGKYIVAINVHGAFDGYVDVDVCTFKKREGEAGKWIIPEGRIMSIYYWKPLPILPKWMIEEIEG